MQTTHLNSLLNQLNQVNKQIRDVEPHGYVTNDLYDEQDRLIYEISGYMKVSVSREESSGKPNSAAEGAVNLFFVDANGTRHAMVDGSNPDNLQQITMTKGRKRWLAISTVGMRSSQSFLLRNCMIYI